MVKQTAMARPTHATSRLENENIYHPKLYCCAPFLRERALWHARRETTCGPRTPIKSVLRLRRRRVGSRYTAGRNQESVRSGDYNLALGGDLSRSAG